MQAFDFLLFLLLRLRLFQPQFVHFFKRFQEFVSFFCVYKYSQSNKYVHANEQHDEMRCDVITACVAITAHNTYIELKTSFNK